MPSSLPTPHSPQQKTNQYRRALPPPYPSKHRRVGVGCVMCSSSTRSRSSSSSPGKTNKGRLDRNERDKAFAFNLDQAMRADASLSPLTAISRPSGLLLRVSVAFALLSACYGWVLSGVTISNVFRAVKGTPWKKAVDKKVCVCGSYRLISED